MTTSAPQLALTRIVNAPRLKAYTAFTDPDQFAAWWGPVGNSISRDEVEFDVRPGGFLRWTETFPDDSRVQVRLQIELTAVVESELIEGVLHVEGVLPGGFEPFETRMRVEFHDDGEDRTRLEVRQWLPPHLASPTELGWGEAFSKLDALLAT